MTAIYAAAIVGALVGSFATVLVGEWIAVQRSRRRRSRLELPGDRVVRSRR
jgi:membrane protein DedA with SNARE-associated domain